MTIPYCHEAVYGNEGLLSKAGFFRKVAEECEAANIKFLCKISLPGLNCYPYSSNL